MSLVELRGFSSSDPTSSNASNPAGREFRSIYERWMEAFGVDDRRAASWTKVFPAIVDLDDSRAPSLEDVVSCLMETKDLDRSPSSLFDHYMEVREFGAARRVLDLVEPETERQKLAINLSKELGSAIARFDMSFDDVKSTRTELARLGVSDPEFDKTKRWLEEAEALRQADRLGPAFDKLLRAAGVLESLYKRESSVIAENIGLLSTRVQSCQDQALADRAREYLESARRYLDDGELYLAVEDAGRCSVTLEGNPPSDHRATPEDSPPSDAGETAGGHSVLRHPGEFPARVDITDVIEWLSKRNVAKAQVDRASWNEFLERWGIPFLRAVEQFDDIDPNDLDETERREANTQALVICKCLKCFKDAASKKPLARRDNRAGMANPWIQFFRWFLQAVGVGKNYAPEQIEQLMYTDQEYVGRTRFRPGISVKGSFLCSRNFPEGLPVLCWRDPNRTAVGQLASAIERSSLRGGPGVVFTPFKLAVQTLREFSQQLPGFAVLDETAVMRILLAPTRPERLDRFVMEMASQIRPVLVSPFVQQGIVPDHMFFGREMELAQLVAPNGPAVIYGGRKLGKSSLLAELERAFERKRKGYNVAVYLDIVSAGRAQGSVRQVLHDILRKLCEPPAGKSWRIGTDKKTGKPIYGGFGGCLRPTSDPNEFKSQMAGLCRRFPEHKFLILLDEAGDFLQALSRPQDPDSPLGSDERDVGWMLRSLRNETDGQVDFVFAGFQAIYRVVRDTLSPFYNFRGTSLAPLTVLKEDEARSLVERPLSLLGLRFEKKSLVSRILDYTGRHPSLLQEFCHRLFLKVRERSAGARPPIDITSHDLDAVFNDPEFRKQAFSAIYLNVEGSEQPKLILRLILYLWLDELHNPTPFKSDRQSFTSRDVYNLLCSRFGQKDVDRVVRMDEIEAYLMDLHVLGVLSQGAGGGYSLANKYFASMVYEQVPLEQEIPHLWREITNPPQAVPRSWIYKVHESGDALSPLERKDEERVILAKDPKVLLVLGAPGTGRSLVLSWLGTERARRREAPHGRKAEMIRRISWRDCRSLAEALERMQGTFGVRKGAGWEELNRAILNWAEASGQDGSPVVLAIDDSEHLLGDEVFVKLVEGRGGELKDVGLVAKLARLSRDAGRRLQVAITGGPALARLWTEWYEVLAESAFAVTLRRYGECDKPWWFKANKLEAPAEVRDSVWRATGGEPRLLRAFLKHVGAERLDGELEISLAEAAAFEESVRTHADTPAVRWLHEMALSLDRRARVCLTLLAHHAMQLGEYDITPTWIELLKDALKSCAETADALPKGLPADDVKEVSGWTMFQWEREIRALEAVDELGPAPSGAQDVIARVREGDPWLSFIASSWPAQVAMEA